ncbi:MAG: SDR family NAD(P)-dependent oxidoreductase, partial [Fulvivirga sp.]
MDKIAYITGGSKGIGFGIAESILREGGKVAITSRSLAAAEKAAKELIAKTNNENVLPLEADVRSLSSQEAAIQATI